jgi:hypothetical protein
VRIKYLIHQTIVGGIDQMKHIITMSNEELWNELLIVGEKPCWRPSSRKKWFGRYKELYTELLKRNLEKINKDLGKWLIK